MNFFVLTKYCVLCLLLYFVAGERPKRESLAKPLQEKRGKDKQEREARYSLLILVWNRDRLLVSRKQKKRVCQSLSELGKKDELWDSVCEFGKET